MDGDGGHELAAGYVLGALDENERRAFEEHLETCERCRDEIGSLSDAAAALAFAAEGPALPGELKTRILAAARAEAGNVVPLRRRWNPAWATSVAAAAALAIGLGLWATLGTSGSPSGAQRVALEGHVGTLSVSGSGEATLTVQNLSPAPAGRTYEIWVFVQGKPFAAGLFARGGPEVSVRVERKVRPGETVAVTMEQAGGVDAPTSTPLLQASLPA